MVPAETFLGTFRSNVRALPTKAALVYCSGSGEPDEEQTTTYAELDAAARARAAWLQRSCAPGDRALLLHPPGPEFLYAFLGCVYAGVVPVPAPPPTTDKRQIERTAGIGQDADVALVLTTTPLAEQLRERLAQVPTARPLRVATSDAEAIGDPDGWKPPPPRPDSVAFLQYTSGSTSEPKGVMVTQANLLHNLQSIRRTALTGDRAVIVTWLPHFHDMGLIGSLLYPIFVGGTVVAMSPLAFLKRPVRLLETISRWRGTVTMGPDFAYDLCTRVVSTEQVASLDLSSLNWVLNGAEPVRAATLERFTQRFAAAGFRPGSFAPCYGMAEATLLVTTVAPAASPTFYSADPDGLERNEIRPSTGARGTTLVGCGRLDGTEVRVVDPLSRSVREPGQIGEIWLRGGSIARGYWNRPDVTAEVFGAYTADGDGPFLRTGDLGAVVDGEVYITGRLKDVLIVHGRNIYPQDIEYFVRELHPALGAGVGVAFEVSGDRPHIVIVQEVKSALLDGIAPAELAARVKVAVAKSFDVPAPSVVLANRGTVRRTTSGKVQRRLMRSLFLDDLLPALHEDVSPSIRRGREARPAAAYTA